jgi:UDP-N-acetylmuramoyl-L-alanyl-D-glutamate--2,6-diaminopimelate ligase
MGALRTPAAAADWLRQRGAGTLCVDSRAVHPGDAFFAWPGAVTDGRRFVGGALQRGAAACLVDDDGAAAFNFNTEARVMRYAGLKAAAGPIADLHYGSPSKALKVLAVTGTNGKTSTAWWLAAALSRLPAPAFGSCGVVGTLGAGVFPIAGARGLPTPYALALQHQLRAFVDAGATCCAMEASSVGLVEHRLDGTAIDVALFTNLTQDHLDYHGTMEAYWRAKALLFDWPTLSAAVVNLDDPRGPELARHVRERGLDVWTVALGHAARLVAKDLHHGARGLDFTVAEGDREVTLNTALVGRYNVSNVLGVIGALRALGVSLEQAVRACAALPPVPGRMERIEAEATGPMAIVDFAHTPDALEKALTALRPLAAHRGGQLWCVFGCGGHRDRAKRPLMAAVVERLADRPVLTSDNPRDEEPEAIIRDMTAGLRHAAVVMIEPDRARAIALALRQAAAGDVVLIAGKGHETEQEINGVRHHFSDQEQARAALRARAGVVQ